MADTEENKKDEEKELEKAERLERMRLDYAAQAQMRRIQFWATVLASIMSVVTPLLLRSYHAETIEKVDDSRKKVRWDIHDQSEEIKKQTSNATEVAAEAVRAADRVEDKLDVNNLQWKAHNSKKPDDMDMAEKALAKAIEPIHPPVASAKPE